MEKYIILDQVELLVKDYKENGPYRLDEEREDAAAAVQIINDCPEAVEILKAAGVMFSMIGDEAAVFSRADLEAIGGVVFSESEMEDIVDRNDGDIDSVVRDLVIETNKVLGDKKVH
jgi:hypothetical protein